MTVQSILRRMIFVCIRFFELHNPILNLTFVNLRSQ